MRTRLGLVLASLLIVSLAAPAMAAPDKSPVFEEEPLYVEAFLPNPCLGEDFAEWWYVDGTAYLREFTTPSGQFHYADWWRVTTWTDSGFTMPERMIGVDVENSSERTYVFTGTGNYVLTNDDGRKLRLHIIVRATAVDGEFKVDSVDLDITCLGNI